MRALTPGRSRLLLIAFSVAWLVLPVLAGADKEFRIDAQLIWGTNDKTSPDPKHTPVDPELARKFQMMKWKYYFVVNRQSTNAAVGTTVSLKMSEHCTTQLKNLGDRGVEVKLFGNGKQVVTLYDATPRGKDLILAGDATNDTAWFVVLRVGPEGKAGSKGDKRPTNSPPNDAKP